MDGNSASGEDTSVLGRLALAITGLFLLSFYLGFGRFLAGSWREFAALVLAALSYLAGVVWLARLARPRTGTSWRRVSLALPIVGAVAGGLYVLTSTASGFRPAVTGIVVGAVHAWLVWRQARRRTAEAHAPAP